jgi:hypothetical protein
MLTPKKVETKKNVDPPIFLIIGLAILMKNLKILFDINFLVDLLII